MFYFVRLFLKLRYLKNCLSPRRKGAEILFLESICDFASGEAIFGICASHIFGIIQKPLIVNQTMRILP